MKMKKGQPLTSKHIKTPLAEHLRFLYVLLSLSAKACPAGNTKSSGSKGFSTYVILMRGDFG